MLDSISRIEDMFITCEDSEDISSAYDFFLES